MGILRFMPNFIRTQGGFFHLIIFSQLPVFNFIIQQGQEFLLINKSNSSKMSYGAWFKLEKWIYRNQYRSRSGGGMNVLEYSPHQSGSLVSP